MRTFRSFLLEKQYKPRVFKGEKPTTFSEYIRSERELKSLLNGKITLKGIIDLYAIDNKKLADNFQPMLAIKDLESVKEYDRVMKDGFTGKNTQEEMDELIASIKKSGIKEYGIVYIHRKSSGDVTVLLGEGNHRLVVAKQLNIKTMPIMFIYN